MAARVDGDGDRLECPEFWRALIMRLGLNPMPSAYSIKDFSAENGVDPAQAFAKFKTHFHHSDAQH